MTKSLQNLGKMFVPSYHANNTRFREDNVKLKHRMKAVGMEPKLRYFK